MQRYVSVVRQTCAHLCSRCRGGSVSPEKNRTCPPASPRPLRRLPFEQLISRSIADAIVGGFDGDADATAAGELFAACAKAEAATRDNAAVTSREDCFMG